jgi:pilus assembly protein CpaC
MRIFRPHNVTHLTAAFTVIPLLILGVAASAGPLPRSPQPFPERAAAASPHQPEKRKLRLGLNKSAIIALDSDVRDVIIPAPSITSAVVRSARSVYLTGERAGETNAFFIGKDGEQILALDISVEPDHTQMLRVIRRHVAGSRVRAEAMGDQIILSGSVRNAADAVRAADIAARFAGS